VSGNDAELAAAQRIVNGDQYNTISKPTKIVASAAAEIAHQFALGEKPAGETTLFGTPSQLFVPTVVTKENLKEVLVVTKENLKEVLIDSGEIEASELCTKEYAKGCAKLGISAA